MEEYLQINNDKLVKINIEYLKTVNYALFHNRIPVCQGVELTNESDSLLEDVRLKCVGEFIGEYESNIIRSVEPGETVRISSFNIIPDAKQLTNLTERVITDFTLVVSRKEEKFAEEMHEIEFMPYDHWTGLNIFPQTITSFITPNHPVINNIVVKAGAMMKKITGSSVLPEYQTANSRDVRNQVAAVFAAIHELGIVYRSMPASYESVGQRITMPDQVVSSKIGNCIELTLLMATVLEAIGINSVVIFQKGHAYLGVWLVNDCYQSGVGDDPAYIEKLCAEGIDEMMVLESTYVSQENVSFEDAISVAKRNLSDHDEFEMFVDVKRCRLEQIFPLPTRVENNGIWSFESSGVEHDSCILDVKEHDRYDLSQITAASKELNKFDIWERKLLDFSLRNSLLNLSLRRRAVQFISFDVNRIEDHLQDGKEYRIISKPDVDMHVEFNGNLAKSKLLNHLCELISNDIEHQTLHTYLSECETKSVLKNIYRASRNALEETGANSLFLSIGTLRWFETEQSTTPRYAPLLLLPVEIIYKKGNYYIRTRDEEISLNITLMEFLHQNYDISINGLDPLPLDESGVDVPLIFAIVRDALRERKRWDVEEEAILGTFSFSKFLMWNDVHNHRDDFAQNDIISSFVANRLICEPDVINRCLQEIDDQLTPDNIALPVPADSSQLAAVIAGGNGNSFILYGPPGTGKSQTITNLIANALYHGKRVLFVAEKMAALNVVQSRLEKIGLAPFCLELHSNKSTKQHVLKQLDKALKVAHIIPPAEFLATAKKIFSRRKELIAYLKALHNHDSGDGMSLYDCLQRYESIEEAPFPSFRYDAAIDAFIGAEGIKGIEDILGNRLEVVLKLVGDPSCHPLKGLIVDREMLMNADTQVAKMMEASKTLNEACDWDLNLGEAKKLLELILRDNTPAILSEDPQQLRRQWRAVNAKWFIARFFAKRNFVNFLRQFNPLLRDREVDQLIEDLISYRERHDKIAQIHSLIDRYFGVRFSEDVMPDYDCLKNWANMLDQWGRNASRMREWYHWSVYASELRKNGLGCVADAFETTCINPVGIKDAFLKALFRYKAEAKISKSELLTTFEGMLFDEKTAAYKVLAEEFRILTQKELYAKLASCVPRMTDNAYTGSEIGLLNRNISNGGRGTSLRDLFNQLPTLLPRLCPVMLMSPMSVAQYVDLKGGKFDLVIFDEASQMPTSEAVGAIARGKSLIVVGDPKQMPPTSFFTSTNVDAEEASIDDMESVLEDCRTIEVPSLQLSWHYRSRHESLIAFSNNEYYDGALTTFPSADDQRTKVHFVPINGHYEKGTSRSNPAEAEAIVDEIVRRLRNEKLCKNSIGVICFSVTQQGLIEDLLQKRLDGDKELQDAANRMYEPIFIKNLENVQGDERDVILFSIGYGPDKTGKVSMNFGPLNNAGGERRLNVAVSRGRCEMYIFSTLKSVDIDLRRSKAKGVEGLKHFLQYAETGSLPTASQARQVHYNSPVREQIAAELKKLGYNVSTNVGRSQFRVDVAIERQNSPGTYSLGILLDGEGYRETPTTRDRDIVQPSVLQALGWRVMRVWSVDWFRNRERVIAYIVEQLENNVETDNHNENISVFDVAAEQVEETMSNAKSYSQFVTTYEEAALKHDEALMREIIAYEQPVKLMYLCRRINAFRMAERVTPTMQRKIRELANRFYVDESGSIWLDAESSENYNIYRVGSDRDISEIPEIEIRNAILETLEEQVAINNDSLTSIASRKMGFARRGTKIDAAFRKTIDSLLRLGELETAGGNLRISN